MKNQNTAEVVEQLTKQMLWLYIQALNNMIKPLDKN